MKVRKLSKPAWLYVIIIRPLLVKEIPSIVADVTAAKENNRNTLVQGAFFQIDEEELERVV